MQHSTALALSLAALIPATLAPAAADARELGVEPDARLPVMPLGEHVAAGGVGAQ